jgi:Activator of Hsp90 ATPase homolog 1-like protein
LAAASIVVWLEGSNDPRTKERGWIMKDHDFSTSFLVDQTPEEAFLAIQNVRGWWSETIEGDTRTVGDEFTYRHEELHQSRQKLVEAVAAQRVVWRIEDARLSFVENSGEWKGTQLRFEIAARGGKTEVRFTHVGLSPTCECFAACSKGWSFYVGESLRSLLATGRGQPDREEKALGCGYSSPP